MSTAANQHIELDGEVLSQHVSSLDTASESFSSAATATAAPLSSEAFGLLASGILVPAISALSGRSRELLAAAGELSSRVSSATASAHAAFTTLEDEAATSFAGMDS